MRDKKNTHHMHIWALRDTWCYYGNDHKHDSARGNQDSRTMSVSDEDEVLKAESEEEDEEKEKEISGQEDKLESCPLTQDMMAKSLSLLCRTGNGLSHAYVRLDLKSKGLTDLALISSFIHLRYLDISSNHLSDFSPLAGLTQLLWVKGDGNLLQTFEGQPFGQLTYLQWLSFANNRLFDVKGIGGPALETLNLTGNGIQTMQGLEYHNLTNLVTLEFRGNCLETTDAIYLPNLRHLYLAQNNLKRLEGLEKLENLNTLNLRDNQLETLDGLSPNMKSLQYLNVRGNLISSMRALRNLESVGQTLKALVLLENPLAKTDDYRMYVISHLPQLERLDKDPITAEEKSAAQEKEFEDEFAEDQEDN
ncbi:leucine-rich repeat-containing protein 23 isoform X3 [Megalobrama amblycephala]|uniref:leucine-rich repeat-containing protein 23 isoform X3 n=1 Tax=Megalobrama amblycephala TaxID=75352 RepID=UPI0020147C6D|nr:leucine-rich repeat-containing protein 23 isoform X3 [Megalobrama amblycephala]